MSAVSARCAVCGVTRRALAQPRGLLGCWTDGQTDGQWGREQLDARALLSEQSQVTHGEPKELLMCGVVGLVWFGLVWLFWLVVFKTDL